MLVHYYIAFAVGEYHHVHKCALCYTKDQYCITLFVY